MLFRRCLMDSVSDVSDDAHDEDDVELAALLNKFIVAGNDWTLDICRPLLDSRPMAVTAAFVSGEVFARVATSDGSIASFS